MADMLVYECVSCGNTVEVNADESNAPECCGNAMKPAERVDRQDCHKTVTFSKGQYISA